MIMKKSVIHLCNVLILVLLLFLTVLLFWHAKTDKPLQLLIGVLLSILYITWGIIHHSLEGNLHPKIVVEYLLVGAIAITLIITVVWM